MQKITKYAIVAIVLATGLYCMKVKPLDCLLVVAGVGAAYVLLDNLSTESAPSCSCDFNPDHGKLEEGFTALSGSGNEYEVKDDMVVPVSKSVEASTPATSPSPSKSEGVKPLMDSFGVIDTEMGYEQPTENGLIKIKEMPRARYGEVFVDPDAWHPPAMRPPICVTNNGCAVQPVYTQGTYIDLLEWDNSRKITGTEVIKPVSGPLGLKDLKPAA